MDAKLLNHFILATCNVFKNVGNIDLKKEKVNFYPEGHKFVAKVATIIGFTGALKGQIVVTLDETVGMKIASAILMGAPVDSYNELAESGVCELANMIGGEALRLLAENNLVCELSIPSLVRGQAVEVGFSPHTPIFAVEFSCPWGPILVVMRVETPQKS